QRHCNACPICRVALDEARRRMAALKSLPVVEAGEELVGRTEVWLDRQIAVGALHDVPGTLPVGKSSTSGKWSAARTIAAMFAAAAVLIACMHFHYAHLAVSPVDMQVLGERQLLSAGQSSLRVLLFDRTKQKPLADIPVRIELASKADGSVTKLA